MGMVPTFVISAVDKTKKAFTSAIMGTRRLEKATSSMGGAMNSNRRIIQNAGFQISDFTVQVAGGQSAILAMTQQLPQFIQGFGAVGGMLAAVITIAGSVWLAMSRAGASLNELAPIAGVVAEELAGMVEVFKQVGAVAIDMANWVVNNLDQIMVTAAVVAGYFASKWVTSFILARGVVGSLITVLGGLGTVLGGLLKFSFFAAVGYLATQFLKLKKSTGSWSSAILVLKDVFKELVLNVSLYLDVMKESWGAVTSKIEVFWYNMLSVMSKDLASFINTSTKWLQTLWWRIKQGGTSASAATAYMNTLGNVVGDFATEIEAANGSYASHIARMGEIGDKIKASSPRWQELVNLIREADAAGTDIDVRDWFGGGGGGDGAGGAIEAVKSRFKELKEIVEDLATSISTSVGDAFLSLIDGTKTATQAFGDMARSITKKLFDVLVVQKMVANLAQLLGGNIGSGGGALGSLLGGVFGGGRAVGGPVTGGTTYLVGERGPELFTPSGSGTITPNSDLGGGGVTVNQNVTIAAASDGDFDRMLSKRLPMLVETIKSAVVDARMRGGGFSTAMGT